MGTKNSRESEEGYEYSRAKGRNGTSFGISSELLLGLLSATARIRDSVNHGPRVLYYKALRAVNCRAYYEAG